MSLFTDWFYPTVKAAIEHKTFTDWFYPTVKAAIEHKTSQLVLTGIDKYPGLNIFSLMSISCYKSFYYD